MRILIAPDSFKGSLSSVEVARAVAAGWRRARPDDEITLVPLADGGEGTLAAIEASGGWRWQETRTTDPIGRPITARWLRSVDGRHAVVELAEASGLSRLATAERDPMAASTLGTGRVLRAVLDAGVRSAILGIGGSATNDGGAGLLVGLGARIEDGACDLSGLDERLAGLELRVACDVSNPLLGEHGAAATYGPQKGASPAQVAELDQRLARLAGTIAMATGRDERETPGAGAAGGVGFALLSIQDRLGSFALRPGVDLVMDAAGFDDKLADADLVITGEGRIDAQTAFGKTAFGVARRARAAGVACVAVGGGVEPAGAAALWELGAVAIPVVEGPTTVESAMAAGAGPVERGAERMARLVGLLR